MEKNYDYYDYLKYELFETVLPGMLYEKNDAEQEEFFQYLLQDQEKVIREMYSTMCDDDGVTYPYAEGDFEANLFEMQGVNFLQIQMPEHHREISDILRAYILFSNGDDESCMKKYFLIKRFDDGGVFSLHITPEGKGLLGEELTDCSGDMEGEYMSLARDYIRLLVQDMREEEENG